MTDAPPRCAGVILAGGRGDRLGGVFKGGLRLGNRPLTDHACAALAPQTDCLLLACAAPPAASMKDMSVVLDPEDGPGGPAGGLAAAVRWCREHGHSGPILSMAIDTPFFPQDFARKAGSLLSGATGVVVGRYGDHLYPTNALWALEPLSAALDGSARASKGPALIALAEGAGLATLDYRETAPWNPFANINSVAGLLACARALKN